MAVVSVIIATHGRCDSLAETLNSLGNVNVPSTWYVELLVIENGPRDGTEDVVGRFHNHKIITRYIYEPTKGKSRALNRGLAEASGDILLFTDDDVRFCENWVTEMCRPIVEGRGMAVAGGSRIASHALRPWMTRYHRCWMGSTEYLSPTAPTEMAGVNMAYHRSVLSKVQGFDCELGGGALGNAEDVLFSRQVRAAGFPILNGLHVQVEHHPEPRKLHYTTWVRSAECQGRSQAYLLYHWLHQDIRAPILQYAYYWVKLRCRQFILGSYGPDSEGITGWELSYRVDLAKCSQFMVERRRPRNYTRLGRVKINGIR